MRMIGKNWLQSLSDLHPSKLLSFFKQSMMLFFGALYHLIVNFGWLIIVHAILFCIFGELISKIITAQGEIVKTSSPGIHILTLVQSILWFLITSAFLLIIRKSDAIDIKSYFRFFFFKMRYLNAGCSIHYSLINNKKGCKYGTAFKINM